MEHEGYSSKKKAEPKITRVSIGLIGTGPNEGKSLQDIVRENPGGTLSIKFKKKFEQKQNASPLSGNYPALVHQTLRHWKDYLPNKYQELLESGELEDEALLAYEKTMEEWADLTDQGMDYHQAWEMIREKYLFLPEEPGAIEEPEEEEMSSYQLHVEAMRLLRMEDELQQEKVWKQQKSNK